MNPNVHLAKKTIAYIDAAIQEDQGNNYRHWLGKVIPHIGDAYRQDDQDDQRGHLGASIIGNDCPRAVYYSYRWFTHGKFNGRMLRLFNRGHMEEARMIACLLTIGVQIFQQDSNGKQFRITHAGGHFGGSGDGVALGIPDLEPNQPALLEFKTHNDKSFKDLQEKGVRESKLEHYVQMQIYMSKMELAVALYLSVNKNTDELYGELVPLNSELAEQYLERAERIIFADTPPERISNSPGFWKCRFCNHRRICHQLDNAAPMFSCRSCIHSKPLDSGEWYCNLHNRTLSKQDQVNGCTSYQPIT